jgi:hypothetical protein
MSAFGGKADIADAMRNVRFVPRYLHGTGKSLFAWDCVVADAVAVEPVSQVESLLTGKLTGNFANSVPIRSLRC